MSANYRPDLSEYGVVIPLPITPVKLPPVTVTEDVLGYRPHLEDVISAALEAGLKEPTPQPLPGAAALRSWLTPARVSELCTPPQYAPAPVLGSAAVLMPFTDVEVEEQCRRQAQAAQLNATITACLERVRATEDVRRMLDRPLHRVDPA